MLETKESASAEKVFQKSRKVITGIFIYQTIFLVATLILLFLINATNFVPLNLQADILVIINAALFGWAGCLVYFSRKSYVYLITNKFYKIYLDKKEKREPDSNIVTIMHGYYLYLIFRPFVGLIIGPLMYMLSLTGLITFMKASAAVSVELSRSGRYFIYFLSFLAGHALSDILDYFSKLAKRISVIEKKDDVT